MSDIAQRLINKGVELLARREQGAAELAAKLSDRVPEASDEAVADAIAMLKEKGWLDEQRFVETAVQYHLRRGDGPLKIRHKVAGKLEETWRLDEALALSETVWSEVARQALIKKFGDAKRPRDPKEVARRLRFLQNRGFTQAHCWAAFEQE